MSEDTIKIEKTPEEEAQEKKVFWARFTVFILAGFITPIVYLIVRYNLFKPTSGLQIGIWGCIVFFIIIGLIGTLIWYYLEGMKHKYSIWKQIISGCVKIVLPMIGVALLLQVIKDNIDLMIETLWVFAGCELLAIPFNPLPKWAFENDIDGRGDIAKAIYDKIKGNEKEEEK